MDGCVYEFIHTAILLRMRRALELGGAYRGSHGYQTDLLFGVGLELELGGVRLRVMTLLPPPRTLQ